MRRRKSSQFCSTSNFKLSSKFSFSFLPLVDFLLLQFPITQFYLQIFKPILDSAWKLKSPHKNTEVLLQYTKECSWVLVTLVHPGHCKYITVCAILFCVLYCEADRLSLKVTRRALQLFTLPRRERAASRERSSATRVESSLARCMGRKNVPMGTYTHENNRTGDWNRPSRIGLMCC